LSETIGQEELRARRAHAYENPRPEVQALVPREARRVLDLGCSSGALGAEIKARQDAQVVGVELDPAYAEEARERLDGCLIADVEELFAGEPEDELGRFDCVVAADLLEHLRDPWSTLRSAVRLLDPGGSVVVSLPNIRFWETFWQLGRHATFPRRDSGIFDATHLRFFTYSDALKLLEQAGLRVVEVSPQYRVRPEISDLDRFTPLLAKTKLRTFFAFQYVMRAVKDGQ
jgi:2-polyprenyl-3-methyl-5-hydroxy-6-metoxy-1,4-benzoquinol methylase